MLGVEAKEGEMSDDSEAAAFTPPTITGAQLRTARERLGLKRVDLARLLGVGLTTLEEYEAGFRRENRRPIRIPAVYAYAMSALTFGLPPLGSLPQEQFPTVAAQGSRQAKAAESAAA